MLSSLLTKFGLIAALFLAVHHLPTSMISNENSASNAVSQECFLGEVKLFAGNYTPRNYKNCEGQLLPIYQYQTLYSIMGTMYGGDGRQNFGLPDLRGRVAVGVGRPSYGGTERYQGAKWGQEKAYLRVENLPAHKHNTSVTVHAASTSGALSSNADDKVLATVGRGSNQNLEIYSDDSNSADLRADAATVSMDNTGGNQPFSIEQPSTNLRYIICVDGTYPNRQ